jgi:hypothetical protein
VVFADFIAEPVDVLVVFGADAAFIGFCVETGFIIFGVETGFIVLGEVAGFIPFGCIAAAGFMVLVACGEVVGCCGFAPPRPWSAITTTPIVRNNAVNPHMYRVRCMVFLPGRDLARRILIRKRHTGCPDRGNRLYRAGLY